MCSLVRWLWEFFYLPDEDVSTWGNGDTILERIDQMALDLKKLADEVAEVVSTQASAVKVIDGLKDELRIVSAKLAYQDVDTSALDELIEKLDHSTDALANAIATPAETTTTVSSTDADVPPTPSDVGH